MIVHAMDSLAYCPPAQPGLSSLMTQNHSTSLLPLFCKPEHDKMDQHQVILNSTVSLAGAQLG